MSINKTFYFLTIISLIFFNSCSSEKKKTDKVEISKIEFIDGKIHDFGNIKENSDASHEFVFKNTGKNPIIITNVKSSCGCTVPTYPKEPIAVGKEASVKVKYDSKRIGKFNKTITVFANIKETSVLLKIRGNVEKLDSLEVQDNTNKQVEVDEKNE